MGKGRRSQGPVNRAPERAASVETSNEFDVGNAAHAEELDGRYIPIDAAGDAAKPIVEHAQLSVELRYEGETPIARLLELLQASNLPQDNRDWLAHRLGITASNVERIDKALVAAFGEPVDAARARAEVALERVATALREGEARDGGWWTGREWVGTAPATRVRDAVDGLISALAGDNGEKIVELVRTVSLGIVLDEDDEEPPILWPDAT